ncbi:MAG: aerobic carbon-monoxide dehydrogenase medium subunit [Chloroflexota bacterium]|jgi:carbon-monoxide dehydrogenase medium subunit|nr:aerobic carbon-monoxide dehydrogenase medium subunit [Chloroflexota bacterium]
MRPFSYERPRTLPAAIDLLAGGASAAALAGGTDLIIGLRDGSVRPEVVVDLKGIDEIETGIQVDGDRLVIGGRAVMEDIAADPRVRRDFMALAEAAAVVGSVQIRNRATLAGNLCNASPAADTAPALLVYDASVVVVGPAGSRRIAVDDFFRGPGTTALVPGELVTAIELPLPPARRGAVHLRRTRRRGHDLASVTLAVAVEDGGRVRLAYGSVGPRPILVTDDSGVLTDRGSSAEARASAMERLLAAASPSPRSMRASPEYRLAMLRVLADRALGAAVQRMQGQPA